MVDEGKNRLSEAAFDPGGPELHAIALIQFHAKRKRPAGNELAQAAASNPEQMLSRLRWPL